MWLLQRKNIHKKITLWLKITGFCLFFHIIFLLWIFCIYQENKFIYAFSIDKKIDYSAPILFVPLGISTAAKSVQNAVTVTTQKTTATNTTPPQKKTTIIAPVKPKNTKPVSSSAPSFAKAEFILSPVEGADRSADKQKSDIDLTASNQKEQIKDKKSDKKTDIAGKKKTAEPAKKQASAPAAAIPMQRRMAHDSKSQISHNYREVEALRRGAQLQKELVSQWHPPIGISPHCTCDISFFVNKKGKIENLKTTKSSGIIMFDISARQALCAMKMPPWTHGKPLIISFK